MFGSDFAFYLKAYRKVPQRIVINLGIIFLALKSIALHISTSGFIYPALYICANMLKYACENFCVSFLGAYLAVVVLQANL